MMMVIQNNNLIQAVIISWAACICFVYIWMYELPEGLWSQVEMDDSFNYGYRLAPVPLIHLWVPRQAKDRLLETAM